MPALGEFIPGPACSAGASSKEGKSRTGSQQKDSSGASKSSSKKDGTKNLISPKHSSSSSSSSGSSHTRTCSGDESSSVKGKDFTKSNDGSHQKDLSSPSLSGKSGTEKDKSDKSKKTLNKVGNVTVPGGLEVKVSQYDSSIKDHPIKSSMSPSSGSDRDSVPHRTQSTGSDHSARDHGRMSNPPCFSPPSMYSPLAGYPLTPAISPHHLKPHEIPVSLSSEEQRRYLEWHYAASAAAKRGYYYEPPTLRLPGQELMKQEHRLPHSYPSPKSDGRSSHSSPRLDSRSGLLTMETKVEGGKQEKSCQREQIPAAYGSPPESMLRSVLTAGIHRPPASTELQQRDSSPTGSNSSKNSKQGTDEKPYTMLKNKTGNESSVPGRSTPGTKSSDGRHPPVGIAVAQKRQDSDSAAKGQRSASNSSRSKYSLHDVLRNDNET